MREKDLVGLLKQAREISGLSLDFWDELTRDFDHNSVAILCGRSRLFPKYMKSKVNE